MEPAESLGTNVWLVVFCDEINLPENDLYGTQRVIMFIRHLVEQGGFWRDDNVWIKTNRIQFVGACNPPTDAGRVELSSRFLPHVPLLLVDFPVSEENSSCFKSFNLLCWPLVLNSFATFGPQLLHRFDACLSQTSSFSSNLYCIFCGL